jgi:16S rRNA (uracil1498-N3)-methyltransferase
MNENPSVGGFSLFLPLFLSGFLLGLGRGFVAALSSVRSIHAQHPHARHLVMSNLWLHIVAIPSVGEHAAIARDEARHAFGARRLNAGDQVTLFDGAGTIADAVLCDERGRDGSVLVEITARREEPRPSPETTIAFAVPKGDRLSTLLDLATQAGIARLVAIECARSVVDADKLDRSERCQRIVAESAKVAKRAWMPELATGGDLVAFVRTELARGAAVAVAHTEDGAGAVRAGLLAWRSSLDATQPRTVVIGPEGGFEPSELETLRTCGASFVSLGPCVMRVETAAVAAAVLLQA